MTYPAYPFAVSTKSVANLTISPGSPYLLTGQLIVDVLTFQPGGVMTVTGDASLTVNSLVLPSASPAAGYHHIVIVGADGPDGANGLPGPAGLNGSPGSNASCAWGGGFIAHDGQTGAVGGAGGNGQTGQPGALGQDAPSLAVFIGQITGGPLLILTRGGDGGCGGHGGAGGIGGTGGTGGNGTRCGLFVATPGSGATGGNGGNGGPGGQGGDGGRPGMVRVSCPTTSDAQISVQPGLGGAGGSGGNSGPGGSGGFGGNGIVAPGNLGQNGLPGMAGTPGPAGATLPIPAGLVQIFPTT